MRLRPIEEQVAVIMGASSGIGRETAIAFASRGAKVVCSARNADALDSLVGAIRGFGGEAVAIPADTTDIYAVRRVAETAVEHFGRIDTWVQLAAVSIWARFEETTPEEFEEVVRTNLVGQAFGAMAAIPHLRRNGRGAFIGVSSVEAVRALPYQSAYAASKHGVAGMLEAIRTELRHDGVPVAVTNIMPSTINTPLFDKARTKLGVKPVGMPPIYEPRIVVEAILHAAEHPTRELVVGGGGRMLIAADSLFPGLVDRFMALFGFRSQRTDEPKSAHAPDNLERPIGGYGRVQGDFSDRAREGSLYTSFRTSRWRTPVLAALALGAGALLVGSLRRGERGDTSAAQRDDRRYEAQPMQLR